MLVVCIPRAPEIYFWFAFCFVQPLLLLFSSINQSRNSWWKDHLQCAYLIVVLVWHSTNEMHSFASHLVNVQMCSELWQWPRIFFLFPRVGKRVLTQTRIWLRGRSGVICNAYSLPGNNCQLILGFIIPSHVCSWLLWLLGSVCHVWHLSFSCFQPEDYEGVKRLP